MMIDDDNDGQMIFGDLGGLKLPDICLTGEEKPQKNLTQETCPDRGSNPRHAAWQARMLPPGPQRWNRILEDNSFFKYKISTLNRAERNIVQGKQVFMMFVKNVANVHVITISCFKIIKYLQVAWVLDTFWNTITLHRQLHMTLNGIQIYVVLLGMIDFSINLATLKLRS